MYSENACSVHTEYVFFGTLVYEKERLCYQHMQLQTYQQHPIYDNTMTTAGPIYKLHRSSDLLANYYMYVQVHTVHNYTCIVSIFVIRI